MPNPAVILSERCQQILEELTQRTGQDSMDVLEKALEVYRLKVFFDAELRERNATLRKARETQRGKLSDVEAELRRLLGL